MSEGLESYTDCIRETITTGNMMCYACCRPYSTIDPVGKCPDCNSSLVSTAGELTVLDIAESEAHQSFPSQEGSEFSLDLDELVPTVELTAEDETGRLLVFTVKDPFSDSPEIASISYDQNEVFPWSSTWDSSLVPDVVFEALSEYLGTEPCLS